MQQTMKTGTGLSLAKITTTTIIIFLTLSKAVKI